METISKSNISKFKIIVLFAFIFCVGCQNQNEINFENCDPTIIKSPELENYIIAAIDLQESITIFEKELAKVDFTKLETIINSDGRKITHLPISIRSLNIEQKVANMNARKDDLFNKHPQFHSFKQNDIINYINYCINESTKINNYLLDNNILLYSPLTKSNFNESYDDMGYLVGHLYNWTLSSDYVEVYIVFYTNGTSTVVSDSRNTQTDCYISLISANGKYYYPSYSYEYEIQSLSHTHRGSSYPSSNDIAVKNGCPGLSLSIYYNGSFYSY